MKMIPKKLGGTTILLVGFVLVSCSSAPPDEVIEKLILQSCRDISDVEIIKIGEYDRTLNRCPVRVKYVWSPNPSFQEECVADLIFFKDIVNGQWKLHKSTKTLSRTRIS